MSDFKHRENTKIKFARSWHIALLEFPLNFLSRGSVYAPLGVRVRASVYAPLGVRVRASVCAPLGTCESVRNLN